MFWLLPGSPKYVTRSRRICSVTPHKTAANDRYCAARLRHAPYKSRPKAPFKPPNKAFGGYVLASARIAEIRDAIAPHLLEYVTRSRRICSVTPHKMAANDRYCAARLRHAPYKSRQKLHLSPRTVVRGLLRLRYIYTLNDTIKCGRWTWKGGVLLIFQLLLGDKDPHDKGVGQKFGECARRFGDKSRHHVIFFAL